MVPACGKLGVSDWDDNNDNGDSKDNGDGVETDCDEGTYAKNVNDEIFSINYYGWVEVVH